MISSKIKILHLEDEATDAELVSRCLRKSEVDFDLRVVDAKLEFQNALSDFSPDVILSDHGLPTFNSLEALEMLRTSGLEIPFILISGTVNEEFGVIAVKNGVDDYVLKDRLHRLPIAVVSAIERYRIKRERKRTERENEQAQKQVKESERQYVELLYNLPTAVYRCDSLGRITLYNDAMTELWGRKPDVDKELWCGAWRTYDRNGQLLTREDSPMAVAVRQAVKIDGEELTIERPDGTKRYVKAYPRPNYDSDGIVIGGTSTIVDVTAARQTSVESLLLLERLQLKNKELGQFGYMISHNLRAPIARILGLASIFDVEPKENKFIIDKIAEATTELDSIVRDINIVVSARNSEKEKIEFVSFENQFRLVTQVLEREISQAQASLTTDFNEVRGVISVKNYVYSVLYNILSNAIKFRSPEKPLNIHVQSSQDQDSVFLSVKDNGMGIDLGKNGSKIFGLYKRFNIDVPGKGIGLHLVKAQVEALGGRVEVESTVNEGSEFKICLPRKNEVVA